MVNAGRYRIVHLEAELLGPAAAPQSPLADPHVQDSSVHSKPSQSGNAEQQNSANCASEGDKAACDTHAADVIQAVLSGLSCQAVPVYAPRPGASAADCNADANHSIEEPIMMVRSLPTVLLYDDRGLDLFDQITYLEEYYPTNAEEEILKRYSDDIASKYMDDGSTLLELGVGSMRKVVHLLDAIARHRRHVTYYALDLCLAPLEESLCALAARYPTINFVGLVGNYHQGLAWCRANLSAEQGEPQDGSPSPRRVLMWLGSSIGNYSRQEAYDFVAECRDTVLRPGDFYLIGMDRRNPRPIIELAYNDPAGVTRDFIINGLHHCNNLMGQQVFDVPSFEYVARYHERIGRHEAYLRSKVAQTLRVPTQELSQVPAGQEPSYMEVQLQAGELIHIEYSYKYGREEVAELGCKTALRHVGCWSDRRDMYDLHLYQRPPFWLGHLQAPDQAGCRALLPPGILASNLPSWQDWTQIWAAWDFLALELVAEGAHGVAPIALRHPIIFYVGHLPAFLDIKIGQAQEGCEGMPQDSALTGPAYFAHVFSRGIDPFVDDPTKCHSHPDVPDAWPELADVLRYRDAVRSRLERMYSAEGRWSPLMQRAMWMAFEHEAMHLETFVYMLVQMPQGLLGSHRKLAPPVLPLTMRPAYGAAAAAAVAASAKASKGAAAAAAVTAEGSNELTALLQEVQGDVGMAVRACLPPHAGMVDVPAVAGLVEGIDPRVLASPLSAAAKVAVLEPAAKAVPAELDMAVYIQSSLVNGHKGPANGHAADASSKSNGDGVHTNGGGFHTNGMSVHTNGTGTVVDVSSEDSDSDSLPAAHADGQPGHRAAAALFGWDNEGPARRVSVPGFSMQDRPVTIGEFFAFLQEVRGLPPAATVAAEAAASQPAGAGPPAKPTVPAWATEFPLVPLSWQPMVQGESGSVVGWGVRTLFGPIPLERAWTWPVFTSQQQAQAYCEQHGLQLPTEEQLVWARQVAERQAHTMGLPQLSGQNLGLLKWHPQDVVLASCSGHAAVAGPGMMDLVGNGWEWSSTPFHPFQGFTPDPLYPEYSTDFFAGRHVALRGASWATHPCLARHSFRNYYQRAYPYVFAKFRGVKPAQV